MHLIRIFTFLCICTLGFASTPSDEIEGLLGYLKGLDGATFIRNGDEHTAIEAEAHLRMKWKNAGSKIRSAEDFITLCASKSSISGQRYQIRLKNGPLKYSDEFLTERLHETRKTANPQGGTSHAAH